MGSAMKEKVKDATRTCTTYLNRATSKTRTLSDSPSKAATGLKCPPPVWPRASLLKLEIITLEDWASEHCSTAAARKASRPPALGLSSSRPSALSTPSARCMASKAPLRRATQRRSNSVSPAPSSRPRVWQAPRRLQKSRLVSANHLQPPFQTLRGSTLSAFKATARVVSAQYAGSDCI